MDPSPIVKRALLHNISALCIFLGRQKTNDVILSHMITYLNDRDWLLRQAFFESIVDVAACAGGRSLEEYILPLMVQALSGECTDPISRFDVLTDADVEESVVARVLSALTSLCELGLFQKMRIWELMSATLCFFYHPNAWVRQGLFFYVPVSHRRSYVRNQGRLRSSPRQRNISSRATYGVFCTPPCVIYCVPTSGRWMSRAC